MKTMYAHELVPGMMISEFAGSKMDLVISVRRVTFSRANVKDELFELILVSSDPSVKKLRTIMALGDHEINAES